jgi:hypothetical protein
VFIHRRAEHLDDRGVVIAGDGPRKICDLSESLANQWLPPFGQWFSARLDVV